MKRLLITLTLLSFNASSQNTVHELPLSDSYVRQHNLCMISKNLYDECMGYQTSSKSYICEDNLGNTKAEITLERGNIYLKYEGESLLHKGTYTEHVITDNNRLNGDTELKAHIKDSYKPDGSKTNHNISIWGIKARNSDDYHLKIKSAYFLYSVNCYLNQRNI